jgi:signal transduction histidine kinase
MAAVAVLASAPALASGHTGGVLRELGSQRSVSVGLLADYAPLQRWPENEAPSGYDVDLLEALARETGLHFSFRRYTRFDDLMQALRAGEVQVVSSVAATPDRLADLLFTRPYVVQQQAMLARADITSLAGLPDLAGRRLALVAGFASAYVAVERFPQAPKVVFNTLTEAVRAVQAGEADVVFDALPVLAAYAEASSGLRLLRTFDFAIGQLRLATLKTEAELVQRLDAALAARLPADNQALIARWIQPQAPRSESRPAAPVPVPHAPLRVGFLRNDPGTAPDANGLPRGMTIDLLQAVLYRAGLQAGRFVGVGLTEGMERLRNGSIDLMLGLSESAQRREGLWFVGPYASNPLALVSRRLAPVTALNAETGTVAMVKGYFAKPLLSDQHPGIDQVHCADVSACLTMLERGEVQAVIYPLQGLYERLSLRESGLVISGVVPGVMDEENLALGPHTASLAPSLRSALDAALREDLPALQRQRALLAQRGGVSWALVWPWLLGAAACLLLLAAAVWLHTRRLQREIRQKQAAREQAERYLAFMTHEVRNALQSVAGATTLLQEAQSQDQAADRQVLLNLMTRAARSTMALMDTLLERHRSQQVGISIERKPCALAASVGQLVQDMQPVAAAKGLSLTLQSADPFPGELLLDQTRVQQVLRNLIINAIKFTARGGVTVDLRVGPSERGAGWRRVRMAVQDTGRGLQTSELARIFTPFTTSEGDRPGTGLGLALCRDIAQGMGGTVEASGEPGVGSEFVFSFDAERAPEPPLAPVPIERLLLVEASPVDAILLQRAWREQAVKVEVAQSVAAAAKRLRERPGFDLVLCGLRFGDGDLADVVNALPAADADAEAKGLRRPALIAMGSEGAPADIDRLRALGVLGYCRKGDDLRSFVSEVRQRHERG